MSGSTSFQSLPGATKSGRSPQIPHTKSWVFCLPAMCTLINLKLKDITQRSCQYPHFVTKPYRFTPDELLCTVFVNIGDHCFIDTQVLPFHETKVSQESLIFHAEEGTYFLPSCQPTSSFALSLKWMYFIASSSRFLVKAEAMASLCMSSANVQCK